ncbi:MULTISPECIES: hypothetical protein [unclassified Mesorhizobium]|uniref:hypothetical protein n=1 Tax=unclassified Mesorhizobium TaxID=325217 RepID=UPI0010934AD4|nr:MULTISPECIES: hypothetical protein [unclassified Mesorhizobium]TGP85598.1 hypothetical protein EN861_33005 [Mesorhizobium sp. M8A.F.Ca.ET.218.01.1.1]TGT14749.1 hypothetical protein EN856_32545 [Mesorhizobium sp. M8A.F.Ca.ET.213.01.1.1]
MMVFPILTQLTQLQCPHGIPAIMQPSATKVLIDNGLPMLAGDLASIAGCPFTVPPGKPQPCTTSKFATLSSKVFIEGKPAVLQGVADLGISAEQIPGGPLIYALVQAKVIAS